MAKRHDTVISHVDTRRKSVEAVTAVVGSPSIRLPTVGGWNRVRTDGDGTVTDRNTNRRQTAIFF